MRRLDRFLQRRRIEKAIPWVRPGDRLLDIGCFDASLISRVNEQIESAVGVDPAVELSDTGRTRYIRGRFPVDTKFEDGQFDCVTMLAVLEHVDEPVAFAEECARVLTASGRVVMTVPHALVDEILHLLMALRVIDGMETEEHHGFDVSLTVPIFESAGFVLRKRRRFQLGLNNLFVFEKSA